LISAPELLCKVTVAGLAAEEATAFNPEESVLGAVPLKLESTVHMLKDRSPSFALLSQLPLPGATTFPPISHCGAL